MAKVNEEERAALLRFGELKLEIKDKTKELEGLKPLVRETLLNLGAEDTPVDTENGKFSLRPRRTWTYSEELQAEIKKVEQAKKFEEATGKATFETSYDVYFK